MQYSSPTSRDHLWNEETHYENTELYENMPSPKSKRMSSSGHYKTPTSAKALSSSLSANTNTNQVTNPGVCLMLVNTVTIGYCLMNIVVRVVLVNKLCSKNVLLTLLQKHYFNVFKRSTNNVRLSFQYQYF